MPVDALQHSKCKFIQELMKRKKSNRTQLFIVFLQYVFFYVAMGITASYAINSVLFNSYMRQLSKVDLLSCRLMFIWCHWHVNDLC